MLNASDFLKISSIIDSYVPDSSQDESYKYDQLKILQINSTKIRTHMSFNSKLMC